MRASSSSRTLCAPKAVRSGFAPPAAARHALALVFGAGGLALSLTSLRGPDACTSALCMERISVAAAGIISSWCVCAALHELCNAGGDRDSSSLPPTRQPQQTPPPRPQQQQHSLTVAVALVLVRALLCGIIVALLGWTSAATGQPHIWLMGTMQANATVGAWSAYVLQREPAIAGGRSKSPPAHEPDEEEGGGGGGGGGACGAGKYATPPKCRKSMTLPRGWRYHARDGVFEHKRSGRVQREPPLDAGSPLCADLSTINDEDESRCLLKERGYSSDSDGGMESSMGRGRRRSRAWGAHRGGEAASPRSTPMSVWELRDALGGSQGGGDSSAASGGGAHKKRG